MTPRSRIGGGHRCRADALPPRHREARPAELELDLVADVQISTAASLNNAWLLELPEPDHQAHLGQRGAGEPEDRAAPGGEHARRRRARHRRTHVADPGLVVPGHADDAVSLWHRVRPRWGRRRRRAGGRAPTTSIACALAAPAGSRQLSPDADRPHARRSPAPRCTVRSTAAPSRCRRRSSRDYRRAPDFDGR